jgi:hypothetical protein
LDFLQIITFFAHQNLVEKFELIATTGKNAKMPHSRLSSQPYPPVLFKKRIKELKPGSGYYLITTALRPWLRINGDPGL